jgi:DNA-binding response OmpR family regulator
MNTASTSLHPAVLVVEDDPVSAAFLVDAATAFPAAVTHAGDIRSAIHACGQQTFALWLIDANLPDGRAETLLQQLRAQGHTTPALAHTAHADAPTCAQLRAAGFLEVLSKPMPVARLHTALQQHLAPADTAPPVWNDASAVAAVGGHLGHVTQLRSILLDELPGQQKRINAATALADSDAIRAELHKLTASCGFVGASALALAVQQLRAGPLDAAAKAALDTAIADVLATRRAVLSSL